MAHPFVWSLAAHDNIGTALSRTPFDSGTATELSVQLLGSARSSRQGVIPVLSEFGFFGCLLEY